MESHTPARGTAQHFDIFRLLYPSIELRNKQMEAKTKKFTNNNKESEEEEIYAYFDSIGIKFVQPIEKE